MQVAVQKVHRPSEENSQLPTFSLIMYYAGDIACDVSRVTTKAPCKVPAIHGRHVCKGITASVLHAFSRSHLHGYPYHLRSHPQGLPSPLSDGKEVQQDP